MQCGSVGWDNHSLSTVRHDPRHVGVALVDPVTECRAAEQVLVRDVLHTREGLPTLVHIRG